MGNYDPHIGEIDQDAKNLQTTIEKNPNELITSGGWPLPS